MTKQTKETPKRKDQRIALQAARIDFNTFKVYIRVKKTQPRSLQYKTELSPRGNIYAETESELLENIYTCFKNHIHRAKEVMKILDQESIPFELINEEKDGYMLEIDEPEEPKKKQA